MRGAEPLYPAALLINQDRGVAAASAFLQLVNQLSNLPGRFDVPFEQNETPGTLGMDKGALVVTQRGPGNTGDESLCHMGRIARSGSEGQGRPVSSSPPNTGRRRPDSFCRTARP